MQYANTTVTIVMVLLGFAVFVFTAERFNPFAIPAKNASNGGNRRRYHILGLSAGCLVALSCLAAWFFNSGSFLEGLKASFIAATILLLLLLVVDTVLNLLSNRRAHATQEIHQSSEQSNNSDNADNGSTLVRVNASPDDLSQTHEDQLGSMLREHDLVVLEKTKTITALESTITEMQKDTDALGENYRVELHELKLENERHTELASVLEQRENELKSVHQELESKNVMHNDLVKDLTEGKGQLRSNEPGLNKLKLALASNAQNSNELQKRLQLEAIRERAGRLKMEASAKRALTIARQAIGKLSEHEKKLLK